MLGEVIGHYGIPTQSCVLTHVTNTLAAIERGAPVDLVFQSIGGTEAINSSFGITLALVSLMLQRLQLDVTQRWTVAPLSVVAQGRVAIGDEVGAALRAQTVVVLIGENPGLSSPDCLRIYLTWAPKVGTTDAARNCISNVRPAGLSLETAALTLHRLLVQTRQRQVTGVWLKDDVDQQHSSVEAANPETNRPARWLLGATVPDGKR